MQKGEAFNIQTQKRSRLGSDDLYIVCTPSPPFLQGWGGGVGVEPPTKFSKKRGGDLTGSQLLEEGCWERGGDFFQGGGCDFHIKNKLKSEIFNDKKLISKIIFLYHN